MRHDAVLPVWRQPFSGPGGVSVRGQRGDEAEEQQRELVWIPAIGAELGGDVRDPVQVEDAGDGVADGGHGPCAPRMRLASSPNMTSRI